MRISRNYEAAVRYSELNLAIFPLRPRDKAPATSKGFYDATSDMEQILRWWQSEPRFGIGLPMGSVNRIVAIDVDPRNGGDETLKGLLAQYGDFPHTWVCRTGGGGHHYYFRCPDGVWPTIKTIWPGIDFMGDGGYCAIPYTIHPSGVVYAWEEDHSPNVPLATLPAWILDIVTHRKAALKESAQREIHSGDLVIPAGQRHDKLLSLAGTLRRRAVSQDAILMALLAENEIKCEPPLPEVEVRLIVDSMLKYQPTAEVTIGVPRTPAERQHITTVEILPLQTSPPPEPDWLLSGRLARGDNAILVGPPGSGKSWIALDIAIAGAAGLKPLGYFEPTSSFRTLIIDEENTFDEVWRRFHGICKAWEIERLESLGDNVMLSDPCQGFSFRSDGWVNDLHEKVSIFKPDLIIFDSLIAVATIRDENNAVEVRRFFHDHINPLRKIAGSAILMLHHTSKKVYNFEDEVEDAGLTRGSIDLNAAPDAVFLLRGSRKKTGALTLSQTKIRRGRTPNPVLLSIVDGVNGGIRPLALEARGAIRDTDQAGSTQSLLRGQIAAFLRLKRGWQPSTTIQAYLLDEVGLEAEPAEVRKALTTLLERRTLEKREGENGPEWRLTEKAT